MLQKSSLLLGLLMATAGRVLAPAHSVLYAEPAAATGVLPKKRGSDHHRKVRFGAFLGKDTDLLLKYSTAHLAEAKVSLPSDVLTKEISRFCSRSA